ncbi:hypothetical protein [Metapseudomonas resinovorans]|uniref:Uncharacterized protein n=1 Tax=Metapseudomonas resinovorans NBRC 106553 TaxID=1245471 RepID=S6ALD9_METRE|nr:hypothetical protein [Pseudomonas resinovorans]BAN46168.1 hypothetical protein PCA10_04360 [Pseudomonas resinovorans NBRC 106553]
MRCKTLTTLLVSAVISLPAIAAQWPAGERERFVQDCKSATQAKIEEDNLERYCGCAADKVGNDLSDAELQKLAGQKTPLPESLQKRLEAVSKSCLSQLND